MDANMYVDSFTAREHLLFVDPEVMRAQLLRLLERALDVPFEGDLRPQWHQSLVVVDPVAGSFAQTYLPVDSDGGWTRRPEEPLLLKTFFKSVVLSVLAHQHIWMTEDKVVKGDGSTALSEDLTFLKPGLMWQTVCHYRWETFRDCPGNWKRFLFTLAGIVKMTPVASFKEVKQDFELGLLDEKAEAEIGALRAYIGQTNKPFLWHRVWLQPTGLTPPTWLKGNQKLYGTVGESESADEQDPPLPPWER